MDEKQIIENISDHPFFSGLNPLYFKTLAGCATPMHYQTSQHIFYEQGDADLFYLVQSGKVAIEMFVPGRGVVTLETVGPNETLGWSWLFPPQRWHFSARALEPTETIALDAKKLRGWVGESNEFGHELSKRIAQTLFERLQSTRLRLVDFYGVPA